MVVASVTLLFQWLRGRGRAGEGREGTFHFRFCSQNCFSFLPQKGRGKGGKVSTYFFCLPPFDAFQNKSEKRKRSSPFGTSGSVEGGGETKRRGREKRVKPWMVGEGRGG